ncbi:MAG: hypothetical protein ACP5HH_07255 [Fervidicoccaceae archaeon]
MTERVVFLNGLPLNAFPYQTIQMYIQKLDMQKFKENIELIKQFPKISIANYIRHKGTIELLKKITGLELTPSAENWKYQPKDIIYVITLKNPQRGQEIAELKEDDIDVYFVLVESQTK